MAGQLWQLSAADALEQFRLGTMLPSDLLESTLKRLDQINIKINAFTVVDWEGARASAAASDRRWKSGKPAGPIDGVIFTVKDNITVKGLPCAWGSEAFKSFVPADDETPVERLRDAGCVLLGKTTVSEFTIAQTNVSTRLCGTTRNPWNLRLTTGASSGGAVAALSSGLGQIALATDGGGSIRRPASHCGLVGLKPSTGRVARRNGLPVILDDCEVIGPIARTCADLTLAFREIAKPDVEDRKSLIFDGSTGSSPVAPKARKILYVREIGRHEVDHDILRSCDAASCHLAEMGHHVEAGSLPFDFELYERHWPVIRDAGLAWLLRDRPWEGLISDMHAAMVRRGGELRASDYVEALTAFREIQAQFGRCFRRFDLLMTPTAGSLPWPAEQEGPPRSRVFTGIVNAAGYPAITIPGEPSSNGLPIGFQLVGRFGADWELVELAAGYESRHPWSDRRPDL